MKKSLLALLAILIAAAGGWWWSRGQAPAGSDHWLRVYGHVEVRLVNLAFEGSGRIQELAVLEGARVQPGDLVARLDTRGLELARDGAQARAAAQRERVRELEAGTRPEEIRKLEAELEASRVQATNSEHQQQRVADLAQKRLASPKETDDARATAEAARAASRAIAAALDLARAGARQEQIAAARASLAALEADLALAERNLTEANLRAPAAGIIQSRILEPGDMASPSRPVVTLAVTEPLWARVYIPETALGQVRAGLAAEVTNDSFPDKVYPGWVGYLSPSAEFTPKSVQTEEVRTDLVYQARIFLCDPQEELRLGMPVSARLRLDRPPVERPGCP